MLGMFHDDKTHTQSSFDVHTSLYRDCKLDKQSPQAT
jgi:hypothetical protein